MISNSDLFWQDLGSLGSSVTKSIVGLDGMAGSPAIPLYRMSFMSIFLKPSLPIFQLEVELLEVRGLTKLTHSHTRGSEQ